MKNLIFIFIFLLTFSSPAFAIEDFNTPVPAPDDEVTSSGPDTKFSLATQMRYDAFKDAEVSVSLNIPQERKLIKLYNISPDGTYMRKVNLPNAKVSEYTNGTFEVIFKDSNDKIFKYDKNGNLLGFAIIKNKAKVPFTTYHYNADGQIYQIEIKPQYFRSFVYGLDGLLLEFKIDDKVYNSNGKLIRRKKSFWF